MRLKELSYSMKVGLPDYSSKGLALTAELESSDDIAGCYRKLKEVVESNLNGAPSASSTQDSPNHMKGTGPSQGNGAPMTDPQKQYIFRLLADQGIEGDAAHELLKESFSVKVLTDVTKAQASSKIEELLKGSEGA